MGDSLADSLRQDMECEGLLECFHDLNDLDMIVFTEIVESDGQRSVDDIAEVVGRDRSTVYRSVQRLLQVGVVKQEQINYEDGGYYHVYEPTDGDVVADDMQRMLNAWYAKMGQLIQEYRVKYGDETTGTAPVNTP